MQSVRPASSLRKVAELQEEQRQVLIARYQTLTAEDKVRLYTEQWNKCKVNKAAMHSFLERRQGIPEATYISFGEDLVKLVHYRNVFSNVLSNPIFSSKEPINREKQIMGFLDKLSISKTDRSEDYASPSFLNDVINLVELNMHHYQIDIETALKWTNLKQHSKIRFRKTKQGFEKLELELLADEKALEPEIATLPEDQQAKMRQLAAGKRTSAMLKQFLRQRDVKSSDNDATLGNISRTPVELFTAIQNLTVDFLRLNFEESVRNNEARLMRDAIRMYPQGRYDCRPAAKKMTIESFVPEFRVAVLTLMYFYINYGKVAYEGMIDIDVTTDPAKVLDLILDSYTAKHTIHDAVKAFFDKQVLIQLYQVLQKTFTRYHLSSINALVFMEIKAKLKSDLFYGENGKNTVKFFSVDSDELSRHIAEIYKSLGLNDNDQAAIQSAFKDKMIASRLRNLNRERKEKGMDSKVFVEAYDAIMTLRK